MGIDNNNDKIEKVVEVLEGLEVVHIDTRKIEIKKVRILKKN